MPMVPLVCQTYQHQSPDVSACRTVNLYPESVPAPEGKANNVLIGTPGIRLFADTGQSSSSVVRGVHYTATGVFYAAIGDGVYEVAMNGVTTRRLPIGFGVGRVSMRDNGWHLVVVDGASAWALQLNNNAIFALNVQTTSPQKVEYLGKRFVVTDDSQDYRWSDIGDEGPRTWSALNVDSADSFADPITTLRVVRDELWLWGPRSYEVRRLTADPKYPYQLVGGSAGDIGCGAPDSVASIGETVFWLGSSAAGSNIVYMSSGYSAQPISNYAINYLLSQVGDTSDAIGWAYQQGGHVFYVLTLGMGDRTIVYDVTENAWHERASRDPLLNELHRWSPTFAAQTAAGILLGSSRGPFILELDPEYHLEFSGRALPTVPANPTNPITMQTIPIQRIHQTPHYWQGMETVCVDEFDLDVRAGVGLQTGQGDNPQVMLQLSKDGGNTWGNEHWRSFGRIGRYAQRVAWRNLGRSRSLVVRLVISDPVQVVIAGGRLVFSVMAGGR